MDQQKFECLGLMAGGMAHDFNNLLTSILGNATLARMEVEPGSPVDVSLSEIEATCAHAADLCTQMLVYSGKGAFNCEPFDLQRLLESMKHDLSQSICSTITLDLQSDSPTLPIEADKQQIRRVIENLVTNASEAIGNRSGKIQIRTGTTMLASETDEEGSVCLSLAPGSYCFLEISDTGRGMTDEIKAKAFDPFFTTKLKGRGLGLAFVLGILRAHNGGVKLVSEPERGSRLTILLPAAVGTAAITDPEPTDAEPWRGTGTVLIIEGDAPVRGLTARMLESSGFTTLQAADGISGIEEFQAHATKIVLVLLDLTMPRLGGRETHTRLKAIRPDMPILFMSGYGEHEAAGQIASARRTSFIQKPFQQEDLRKAVQFALGQDSEKS